MIAIVYSQSQLGNQPFRKLREHKAKSLPQKINKPEQSQTQPNQSTRRSRRSGMGSNWFGKT